MGYWGNNSIMGFTKLIFITFIKIVRKMAGSSSHMETKGQIFF